VLDDDDQLHLESEVRGSAVTLHAAGELDIYTSSRLLALVEQLCNGDVDEIVLDGEELAFVDSAGLRALVLAHERAELAGIDLRVASASAALGNVLEITGLGEVLFKQ
jgi:anti-anti-sigma factor